jgi:hypothetical protein
MHDAGARGRSHGRSYRFYKCVLNLVLEYTAVYPDTASTFQNCMDRLVCVCRFSEFQNFKRFETYLPASESYCNSTFTVSLNKLSKINFYLKTSHIKRRASQLEPSVITI